MRGCKRACTDLGRLHSSRPRQECRRTRKARALQRNAGARRPRRAVVSVPAPISNGFTGRGHGSNADVRARRRLFIATQELVDCGGCRSLRTHHAHTVSVRAQRYRRQRRRHRRGDASHCPDTRMYMHSWITAAGKRSNAAGYAIHNRTDSRGTMSSLWGKRITARDASANTAIARDGWPACDARGAVMPCKHDINFLTKDITARQTRRIVRDGRGSRQCTGHLRGKRRMSCAGALTNSRDAVSKAATVPTRRTSDQSISIGAHIHAQTTAWHARRRRSITVVVRDERPLCATRRSVFGVQTARLGRYVQLLVR
jgi:hypothetical protein